MVTMRSENFKENYSICSVEQILQLNTYMSVPSDEGPQFWQALIIFCHSQQNQHIWNTSKPSKNHSQIRHIYRVLCYILYANSLLFLYLLNRTQMDQFKTFRSQELTHPLENNRDQIHTPQKEKIAHSKFKGTARVTGENVKSQELQVRCLL